MRVVKRLERLECVHRPAKAQQGYTITSMCGRVRLEVDGKSGGGMASVWFDYLQMTAEEALESIVDLLPVGGVVAVACIGTTTLTAEEMHALEVQEDPRLLRSPVLLATIDRRRCGQQAL